MVDTICVCDCVETDHKLREKSPADILGSLCNNRYVTVQYHPARMEPIGYFIEQESKMYTPEEMYQSIIIIRDNCSPCRSCNCKKFQADNLKTLERAYERKASKTIY